jgi:phosphate transport system substrate-binding protein
MKKALLGLLTSAVAIVLGLGSAFAEGEQKRIDLHGAGATFPAPLYQKWATAHGAPHVSVSYDAVGSGEGVKRFIGRSVDFAGSDELLSETEAARAKGGAVIIPATSGMIVLAYNIPGISGGLRLPRDVYAGIFSGAIQRWDDPRIKLANPELQLPPRDIALVARLDSSGTNAAFTRHLSTIDPSWAQQGLGVGKLVEWPKRAMLAVGNQGVASRIKMSEGSIGYVEYGFAKRLGLPMAALENKSGTVVSPSGDAAQLALSARDDKLSDLDQSVVDPAAAGAYPIVTYSWLMLYRSYSDADKGKALQEFVLWGLTEGQNYAPELGYVPLSADVVNLGRQALGIVQTQ